MCKRRPDKFKRAVVWIAAKFIHIEIRRAGNMHYVKIVKEKK